MIRPTALSCAASLAALALVSAAPLAAQAQPGGFTLPQPSPTPTPAPQGPADERAGVVIPPRSAPAPRITPAPVLTPEPEVTQPPRPQPSASRPTPSPSASPTRSIVTAPPPSPVTTPAPAPEQSLEVPPTAGAPGDPLAVPSILPSIDAAPAPTTEAEPAEAASTAPGLPAWWPWAAGGLGGLVALGLGAVLWRRRKPKPPRLAAPSEALAAAPSPSPQAAPRTAPVLDVVLDVTGGTRSVMVFTLHYRLTIANRTGQAVSDANLAVLLACARAGADNAVAAGAAQQLDRIERIGPHQNLSLTGSVQLPLAAIAPLHQGRKPLLIPLAHVTLEAEGMPAETRTFVIGTPSAAGTGRLHPIPLDTAPGSINGLMAQRIAVPPLSAAA